MELKKKVYQISAETLERVFPALEKGRAWYSSDGQEGNDDEVIDAYDALLQEVEEQL